jgi:hypothetical protein
MKIKYVQVTDLRLGRRCPRHRFMANFCTRWYFVQRLVLGATMSMTDDRDCRMLNSVGSELTSVVARSYCVEWTRKRI